MHLETFAQLNRYEFPKLIRPPYNDFGKNLPPKGLIYMLKTGCKNVVGNIVQHGCQKWEAGGGACASESVAPTMLLASCFQQPVTTHFLPDSAYLEKFNIKVPSKIWI